MRLHLALTLLLLSFGAPQELQKGVMEGRVVSATTGVGMPNARLTLSVVADPGSPDYLKIPKTFAAPTDSNGHFVFERLEPRKYFLSVEMEGYVRQSYGPVELSADKGIGDIVVSMKPAAVVTGHVVSGRGPLQGVEVVLARSGYDANGRKMILSDEIARTDDHGEYRLFGVQPGSYYLMAHAPTTSDISRRTQIYVPGLPSPEDVLRKYGTVYYPGTREFSQATPIELKPAVELTGFDIVMGEQSTYRVSGTVIDGATGNAASVSVGIFPRNGVGITGSMFPAATTGGKFAMQNIAPGEYVLLGIMFDASSRNSSRSQTPNRMVRGNVDVLGSDVENVVLTLPSLARVAGHLSVEGTDRVALESFQAQLVSVKTGPAIPVPATVVRTHTVPAVDGSILYDGVLPAEYELRFGGLPGDAYVKEARYGEVDVLVNPMRIAGDKDSLQMVISPKGGQILGTAVRADKKPAGGVELSLLPSDRSRLGLYRSVLADGFGRFVIHGVPPGDYKLFSWDGARANTHFDPAFVRAYEDEGISVQISESSRVTVEVQQISVR